MSEEINLKNTTAFMLSKQSLTVIMFCLQNGLLNKTDITEELSNLVFELGTSEEEPDVVKLYVANPPKVKFMETLTNDDEDE